MQDIVNSIYVDGNVLLTFVNMFVYVFALECVLGIANLIKTMGKGVN